MAAHVFADGGYAGPKLNGATQKMGTFTLEIVKRTDNAKGCEVLPRRVVERTFARLGRCRRLAKDWEKSIASAQAWISPTFACLHSGWQELDIKKSF